MSKCVINRPIVAMGHRHPHGGLWGGGHIAEPAVAQIFPTFPTGNSDAGFLSRARTRRGPGAIRGHACEQQSMAGTTELHVFLNATANSANHPGGELRPLEDGPEHDIILTRRRQQLWCRSASAS